MVENMPAVVYKCIKALERMALTSRALPSAILCLVVCCMRALFRSSLRWHEAHAHHQRLLYASVAVTRSPNAFFFSSH